MISINSQLAQELELTYWQISKQEKEVSFTINHDEKELLRKILYAKAIEIKDEMLQVMEHGVVLVQTNNYQLKFDDVEKIDIGNTINLAKLSEMLKDNNQKKLTWYKLKNLDFY